MAYAETICLRCTVVAASYTFIRNACVNDGSPGECYDYGCNDCSDHGYNNYSDYLIYANYTDGEEYYCGEVVCYDMGCYDYENYYCSDYTDDYYYTDYNDCTDACYVKWTYDNYGNESAPNTGAPLSGFAWTTFTSDIASGSYVADAENKIKELRDKIHTLVDNKGRNKVSDADVTTTNSKSGDATFGSGMPVDDLQYTSLRSTLEALYQDLKQTSAGTSAVSSGNSLDEAAINLLRTKVTELANATITYSNCNHSGYSNNSGYNNTGAPNSSYVDSSVCSQYKDSGTYKDNYEYRYS